MDSVCGRCPVSLLCLAEQLTKQVHCGCVKCECYELQGHFDEHTKIFTPNLVPCPRAVAQETGVMLSVCSRCTAQQSRQKRDKLRELQQRYPRG